MHLAAPSQHAEVDEATRQESSRRDATLAALFVLSMLKGADIQMLPASFRAMEHDLHYSPSQLAMIALCQGVACAVTGPVWGNLVDSGASRKFLLQVGAGLWGICTFQLALTSSFTTIIALRVLNGAALAMIVPVVQSMVADLTNVTNCGSAFGKVSCAHSVGQVMACLMVTPISEMWLHGMRGWRLSLGAFGLLSLLTIPFLRIMVYEEPRVWNPRRFGIMRELRTMWQFLKIRSFTVIIAQGVFGTIPSAAQSFTTMYLQYLGVSNSLCGLILALRTIGDGLGNAVGGVLGDLAHAKRPEDGRIFVAMTSVLINIPFMYTVYMGVGPNANGQVLLAGLLFFAGIISSWEVSGCLNPVLIDVMPRRQLASAFTWNVGIVFTSGNMIGPTFVGFTAQHFFKYKLSSEGIETMSPAMRERNAEALGKSLCISCTVPCIISAIFFSMLFCTYPRDKMRQHEEQDAASDSDVPELAKDPTETTKLLAKRPDREAGQAD